MSLHGDPTEKEDRRGEKKKKFTSNVQGDGRDTKQNNHSSRVAVVFLNAEQIYILYFVRFGVTHVATEMLLQKKKKKTATTPGVV